MSHIWNVRNTAYTTLNLHNIAQWIWSGINKKYACFLIEIVYIGWKLSYFIVSTASCPFNQWWRDRSSVFPYQAPHQAAPLVLPHQSYPAKPPCLTYAAPTPTYPTAGTTTPGDSSSQAPLGCPSLYTRSRRLLTGREPRISTLPPLRLLTLHPTLHRPLLPPPTKDSWGNVIRPPVWTTYPFNSLLLDSSWRPRRLGRMTSSQGRKRVNFTRTAWQKQTFKRTCWQYWNH